MSHASPPLPPGFRFHPTDEELILHYLCKRTASAPCPVQIIAEVDIYKFNPWDLPAKAMFGEREWYFFSPRDRKYPNGFRPNRAAASGYWKATGTDKPITASRPRKENIGVKKALVFYKGKPPKGVKTNWIMHEYRLSEALHSSHSKPSKTREAPMRLDDWVLCRIYQKSGHHPLAERREEDSGVQTLTNTNKMHKSLQTLTNTNKMHKSFSISDLLIDDADFALLSRMLETPMNGHFAGHALLSNSNPNPFFAENNNGSYLVAESEDPVFVNKHCFEEKVSSSHVSCQFADINQLAGSQTCFNPQSDAQFSLGNALSLNIYQRNL